jgi:8-oxo-dGTP pyrophosphatase MutT (NUDIX family)
VTRATVLAAGGVLWRADPEQPEVALVHRPEYDDWSLPKGKAKPGEHLLVTALRETLEETGFCGRIGPYLTTVRYRVVSGGRPATKQVTYWSMRCGPGDFVANREVDALRWLPLPVARREVTSGSDRAVLSAFARVSRDTGPLILLRHVSSGGAGKSLDRSGRDRAAKLVPVLEGLGVTELLSADLPGCAETLGPFAAATGLDVRRDGSLTLDGFAGHEGSVADRVRRSASGSPGMVVCGSQSVISGLLTALGRGAPVRPPHDTSVRKGGWWLLHHRQGAVTAYERHEPAA